MQKSKLNNFLLKFSLDEFGDIKSNKPEPKVEIPEPKPQETIHVENKDPNPFKPTMKIDKKEDKAKDEEFLLSDDFDAFGSVDSKRLTEREVSDRGFEFKLEDSSDDEDKMERSDSFVFPEEIREKRPSVMIYEEKRKNFKNLFRELEETETKQGKVHIEGEEEEE